ncbi:trimeric intracellular cation channel family protein [Pelagivirga sediminicola]|uniref:Trimeric intracellular cation channel family protein n=1 Tax=Pelagivirga sediminicola TaxID=2170575 RepID=A0A2T7G918_9RHOB|nr:trimeric intracellular cation channel family protein [Pelagivirga sediminicola]PVA10901.1 trimeric intracellular cation channel family protein [Pelagivirga sediminicola]
MSPPVLLDYASVLIFALTGALVASRAQLDIVGFAFIGALTAVGGGTLRDVMLDRHPIFWMGDPTYILIAVSAAVLIFFTAHLVESRYRWLLWLDSFALAVAVPAGVSAAIMMAQPMPIVVLMGMVTGCLGGLMRDVVIGEVPLVLRKGKLYVSAAFAGALTGALLERLGFEPLIILSACGAVTWALRAGSLAFGWKLPIYKAHPPKE